MGRREIERSEKKGQIKLWEGEGKKLKGGSEKTKWEGGNQTE